MTTATVRASGIAGVGRLRPVRRPARPGAALAVIVFGGLNVGAVVAVAAHGASELGGGAAETLTFAGRVAGLFAELFVVGQLFLAARIPALERRVGQDSLLRWHRVLGQVTLAVVVVHPLLIAAGYGGARVGGFLTQSKELVTTYVAASVAALLIVVAAGLSIGAARRRLPYEVWYAVHLATYAAVILAFGHQLSSGSDLENSRVIAWWWKGQLALAAGCLVAFRLGLPVARSARHGVQVRSVVQESSGAVSIYFTGRRLDRLAAAGGQFFIWRFLTRNGWWEAHPYSLSATPTRYQMRITVGIVGKGTQRLAQLKPGTRVLVEGPYGTFTDDSRTRGKVLLIGAGLGITPLRALLEDTPPQVNVVLLHRVGQAEQAVLTHELGPIIEARGGRAHLVTGPRGAPDDPNRLMGPAHLRYLVPDIRRRDVYLCGPAGFCTATAATLRGMGVPAQRVHHETFAI
ncbi:MAG: ferredoxin reductase family protein [Frankia sp.]